VQLTMICNFYNGIAIVEMGLSSAQLPQIHMYIGLYTSFLFLRYSLFVSFN
jgi:hypothetical protein